MITANEAYKMAKKDRMSDPAFSRLKEKIDLDIMSEADTGHRSALFTQLELGNVTGIEFIVDELRENGFEVIVHRNAYHMFDSMFVSW